MRVLFLIPFLVLLAGCDWIHQAFTNSIPIHGSLEKNPDVYVYLGIDGLAHRSTEEALRRGNIPKEYQLARFISMFPATSDASWTRILHTEKLGGYEYEYYDTNRQRLQNSGLPGLIKHILPTIADSISFEAKYLQAFDYRANGYLHAVGAYHDTFANFSESLDNLFFLLEGRAQTRSAFTGYLLEFDVMGHLNSFEDIQRGLKILFDRIKEFKEKHPKQHFHFSLFSDHGLDFISVPHSQLVNLKTELPKVGVQAVDSLKGRERSEDLIAVPINHTRVTYLAMHAPEKSIEEIAKRTSQLPSIDLVVARLLSPPTALIQGKTVEYYGGWDNGRLVLSFSFDPNLNQYTLSSDSNWERFGLPGLLKGNETIKSYTDLQLFELCKAARYPDLFYRIRSGLSSVGVNFPSDILVSFKAGYASVGFTLPGGANDFQMTGYHGALEDLGSVGTLLSEERILPEAVRSDTLLDLFPKLKNHLSSKGLKYVPGDQNSFLKYQ